jgi:hypothetical protein
MDQRNIRAIQAELNRSLLRGIQVRIMEDQWLPGCQVHCGLRVMEENGDQTLIVLVAVLSSGCGEGFELGKGLFQSLIALWVSERKDSSISSYVTSSASLRSKRECEVKGE